MQTTATATPPITFHSLGLSEATLRAIAEAGFAEPTPIQAQAIPAGLQGRDVLGCAQTGTGKTAAFVIPMIERLAGKPGEPLHAHGHGPRGLILAPTRELAIQIQQTVEKLGRHRRIFAAVIVGGEDMQAQIRALRHRPPIIVATPGRLLDHMWNGTINLAQFSTVVLDEADRMLDMGFAPQLNQILDALPEERQTLLFSATMPTDLGALARVSVKNPVRVMVGKPATPAAGVTQTVHHTTPDAKTPLLLKLLNEPGESVLVFTRTKHRADRLGRTLEQSGHRVAVIHGDRRLSQRRSALEGFRRGKYRILVATDIAARGIDVANIAHVINYDLPNCPEDYVHRIGRTARMKTEGRATSFVTADDRDQIRSIEKLLGRPVPTAAGSQAPGYAHAPHASHAAHPTEAAHNGRHHRRQPRRFHESRGPRQ
ncbi:MAG: DEAD/DEAH box helicase [Nitrospirota bacterium]